MSILTGSIEELMTPQLINRLSVQSGIPGATVRTGMTGAVASILDGLATKARDPRAMNQVADLVHETPVGGEVLFDDAPAMQRQSSQLLGAVGGDSKNLAARLGRYAGVGAGAASGFVSVASAVVIGAFRKLGRMRGGLDASGLATTLLDEQRELHAAVPQAMLEGSAARASDATATVREHVEPGARRAGAIAEPARRRGGWLVPLLLLAALIAAIAMWVDRRTNTPARNATNATNATRPRPTIGAPQPTFAAGTPESKLLDELRAPAPNAAWIELGVRFDTGSSTVQPGAEDQLSNIAKALDAYPDARVQIGGYPDSIEPANADLKLAQSRADAVREQLIAIGIDGKRIDARGYSTPGKPGGHAAIHVVTG
jgi:outer membrane protein OmpA-like peptidoglycan-associated protein